MKSRRVGSRLGVSAWLALSLVAGCAVQLIAPYDQRIDDGVSSLQRSTTQFLTGIERQGGSQPADYPGHTRFYDDAKVAVSGLAVRAGAVGANTLTVQQLDILGRQFTELETQDRTLGIPAAAVPQLQRAFDRTFGAILALEVAKKGAK